MKTIDIRFNEKTMSLLNQFLGKKFEKYKCNPFDFSPTVYGIVGIFVDGLIYKLTNFCDVLDYYGKNEDVAVFKFETSEEKEIKSCIVDEEMIETPINSTIQKIHIINENQKLFYHSEQTYNVWVTRGIIFFLEDNREISFEKNIWFSEDISIQRGYNLIEKFEPTDIFVEGWEECEGYTSSCSREIIELK